MTTDHRRLGDTFTWTESSSQPVVITCGSGPKAAAQPTGPVSCAPSVCEYSRYRAWVEWWSVYVETRGQDPALVTDDAIGDFVTALVPHSGIVTGGGEHPRWGATVSVEAATAADSVTKAVGLVTETGSHAGLPAWPVIRAETVREDVLDEELNLPAVGGR
jgi:hypothetical protein